MGTGARVPGPSRGPRSRRRAARSSRGRGGRISGVHCGARIRFSRFSPRPFPRIANAALAQPCLPPPTLETPAGPLRGGSGSQGRQRLILTVPPEDPGLAVEWAEPAVPIPWLVGAAGPAWRAQRSVGGGQNAVPALPRARPGAHCPPQLGNHRMPLSLKEARLSSQPRCPLCPVLEPGDVHRRQLKADTFLGENGGLAGCGVGSGAEPAGPGAKAVVPWADRRLLALWDSGDLGGPCNWGDSDPGPREPQPAVGPQKELPCSAGRARPLGKLSLPHLGLCPPSPCLCASRWTPASLFRLAPRIFRAAKPLPPSPLAYFLSSPEFIFSLLSASPQTPSQGTPAPPGAPHSGQPVWPSARLLCGQGLCLRYKLRLFGTRRSDSGLLCQQCC